VEPMDLRSKRILYPEEVGFRYETGGMMEQLRVLTADRIRQFHRQMYQPKNLCLVIFGEVDHNQLLEILEKFEDSIMDDIPKPNSPFRRPWLESKYTPQLEKSVIETVEFPEEDESTGEVMIKFLGPSCNDVVQSMPPPLMLMWSQLNKIYSGCLEHPLNIPCRFLSFCVGEHSS
jgi:Zn-dependent M16 (insulinase) family peptidase